MALRCNSSVTDPARRRQAAFNGRIRYGYYECFHKPRPSYPKSIRKADIEGDFEALLQSLRPARTVFEAAQDMSRDRWNALLSSGAHRRAAVKSEMEKIDRRMTRLASRVADTDSDALAKRYEAEIRKLDEQRIVLTEKQARIGRPRRGFDETFRTAMMVLANPWKLWCSDRLADKQTVLKLVFEGRPGYCRKEGFRTPKRPYPSGL